MEKIESKIRKLFELSKSDNQSEAELAIFKANELLVKYNLELSEITDTPSEVVEIEFASGHNIKEWRQYLSFKVAEYNYCKNLTLVGYKGKFWQSFIGRKHNVNSAIAMYHFLEKAIFRIAKKDIPKKAKYKYRESFKYGMVSAIAHTMFELKRTSVNFNPDEKALIVLQNEMYQKENEDFVESKNLETSAKKENKLNNNAFHRGFNSGKSVPLNNQIRNVCV